ncbi:hypothetical protein AVEN_179569-1 [Araneus ventricosus]|uniref:Uncharacterized protein n=1 Tax=Araneus ventricosus TaxID=182803 RepID=A0A4Y2BBU2_ARAVE|nr:hypothetical protein AVEN_179569-1 [Araneus ventricosus]
MKLRCEKACRNLHSERPSYYCSEREPPSIRTLGINSLPGVISIFGLLALRPILESVDPSRARKLSKEVCSSDETEANRRKPKLTITEVSKNRGITANKE